MGPLHLIVSSDSRCVAYSGGPCWFADTHTLSRSLRSSFLLIDSTRGFMGLVGFGIALWRQQAVPKTSEAKTEMTTTA